MVQWATPLALTALVLVALPILLHLFAETPVTRVLVPSLRLLRAQVPRLTRRRRIRDPWLLAVRVGIVAAAALAAAGPLVISAARRASWGARTARAIVVSPELAADAAVRAALDEERSGAVASEVFTAAPHDAAIAPATAWLATQPPARRELVFVGRGTWERLDRRVAEVVPAGVGLRLRAVPGADAVSGLVTWRGADGDGRPVASRLTATPTLPPATAATSAVDLPVLPVELATVPGDAELVSAVWEGVLAGGVFLRSPNTWQAIRVEWPGAPSVEPATATAVTASDRQRLVPLMTAGDEATAPASATPWVVLGPSLQVARRDDTLVLRVSRQPEPAEVERVLRGVLAIAAAVPAVPPGGGPWDAAARRAIERAPGDVDEAAIARLDERDSRWLWLLAAIGLAIETVLRRRRPEVTP